WVRTGIEVSVLAAGWVLGGSIGIATLVYAFGIGPLIQMMIPYVDRFLPGFRVDRVSEPAVVVAAP
ncbi:hypothetical protein ACLMAL_32605, partial [Nocardia sp. CWNU-33]